MREHSLGRIVFDVTLVLTLKGLVLKIQDGKIKAIQTDSCEGNGTIALLEKLVMMDQTA